MDSRSRHILCLVLAAAGVASSSSRAAADCGDYVHIGAAPESAPATQDANEPPAPPARKPCRGPSCSNNLPAPVPAGPAPPNVTQDDPAGAIGEGPDAASPHWFAAADCDDSPIDLPRAVFRPPPR